MQNKELFRQEVYEKYNYYQNHKKEFFAVPILKKSTRTLPILKMVAIFVICIISTLGITYAGITIYEYFTQQASKFDYEKNKEYNIYKDNNMSHGNNIHYIKIDDYQIYQSYQEKFQIPQMTQEDFEDSFMVIITLQSVAMEKLKISSINADETTLYIELDYYSEEEQYDEENTVISTIISRQMEREKLEVYRKEFVPTSPNYINIKELPKDYTLENAIQDGCFVLKNNEVISEDKEQIDEFIKDTKEGKEDFIRIVNSYEMLDKITLITDIQYKSGKYYVYQKQIIGDKEESQDCICIEMQTIHDKALGKIYYLKDRFNQSVSICIVK